MFVTHPLIAAVEEAPQEQHRAEEIQPCEQESTGAVCQLLRAEGQAHVTQGAAGSGLPGHCRADGRLGTTQA